MVTVGDLLKEKGNRVWSVNPEMTTIQALQLLSEKNVGALPVVDNGELVGIISERDFVQRIATEEECRVDLTVGEHMTKKVITVSPDQDLTDCMMLMTDRRIRHLPVVEEGKLVGIISIGDVVKGIIQHQIDQIENMEKYIVGSGYNQ